jgi:RNA polymerase sigma-70 factor (ECF subfamily)
MPQSLRPQPISAVPAPVGGTPADAETALLLRAATDRDAFAPIYDRYLDPIYRYCWRRLRDREAAEEATSQTFVQALAALASYRGGSVAGWLFAIAHRIVLNEVNRRRPSRPIDEAFDVIDPAPTPEEIALAGERDDALRAMLAALPPDQRRVLELRLLGLTGEEIATALGRSVAAVKMLQLRAMTRLRLIGDLRTDGT